MLEIHIVCKNPTRERGEKRTSKPIILGKNIYNMGDMNERNRARNMCKVKRNYHDRGEGSKSKLKHEQRDDETG